MSGESKVVLPGSATTDSQYSDLFSRRAVGWSMSAKLTTQFVLDALMMAVWRRGKPNALLHHSDQGSQYSSDGSSGRWPSRTLLAA